MPSSETLIAQTGGGDCLVGWVSWSPTRARTREVGVLQSLAAIAVHPKLPRWYAAQDDGDSMTIHALELRRDRLSITGSVSAPGSLPCDVHVMERHRMVTTCAYGSGTVVSVLLDQLGDLTGAVVTHHFNGSGTDPSRQESSHPHSTIEHGRGFLVADLGADLLWFCPANGTTATAAALMPSGSGPRTLGVLADGRVVVTGELSGSVIVGAVHHGERWARVPSSSRSGAAHTRGDRNYPGGLVVDRRRQLTYVTNRGHDTVATFDVSGASPRLVGELEPGAAWPSALALALGHGGLLVAGQDSDSVEYCPLDGGIPTAPTCSISWPTPGAMATIHQGLRTT